MKFLSLENFISIIFIAVFTCGAAGYVGDLPKLVTSPDGNRQQENLAPAGNQQPESLRKNPPFSENQYPDNSRKLPPPIRPLAPKEYPAMYEGAVIKQNRYSKYQKDLTPLKDKLEMLKKTMLSEDNSKMQIFCAQVNLVDLYVNYIKSKYAKRPERFYESYKTILIMDKNIVDTANYWKTTMQYMRMIYKSAGERKRNQLSFKRKYDNSLKSVNRVLEILNEDLKKY